MVELASHDRHTTETQDGERKVGTRSTAMTEGDATMDGVNGRQRPQDDYQYPDGVKAHQKRTVRNCASLPNKHNWESREDEFFLPGGSLPAIVWPPGLPLFQFSLCLSFHFCRSYLRHHRGVYWVVCVWDLSASKARSEKRLT